MCTPGKRVTLKGVREFESPPVRHIYIHFRSKKREKMSIESLLRELNPSQREAATFDGSHALVLAGAGCGKTKTIIARAAYLISTGVFPERIQILTFTRRSAAEIVERVRLTLGDRSQGLRASTFHTWCTSILRRAPKAFGFKSFTVIDRDDQIQIFKVLRGKKAAKSFPTAADICDLYSYARNTRTTLDNALQKQLSIYYPQKESIASIMRDYEARKRTRNYFDYDDILDVVAQGISQYPDLCQWLGSLYDHILVDEMQDTNPLQWELLQPLTAHSKLFCVGDDAQSIYGFRGSDFRNVHSFHDRVPTSVVLKLEDNYRSTQEILDLSNWLLSRSAIKYDKKLRAVRGKGLQPRLQTFSNEWEEGRWIAEDLSHRRGEGALWRDHMILVRSSYSARTVEQSLIAKEIPYIFIGGTKLLESAHVKDVLSVLRVSGNYQDEIGWMRYLTLWEGLGEVTASKIVGELVQQNGLEENLKYLSQQKKIPASSVEVIQKILSLEGQISKIISTTVSMMTGVLSEKYKSQDWEKRQRDFGFVAKLAEKHNSILEFLEEYILDPVYHSEIDRNESDDVVHVITIHSAKGTERAVCYVQNVSPGSYPPVYSIANLDDVEEERRVLYVALTRAKNELIVTRKSFNQWAIESQARVKPDVAPADSEREDEAKAKVVKQLVETYFLNELPANLMEEEVHGREPFQIGENGPDQPRQIKFGLDLS